MIKLKNIVLIGMSGVGKTTIGKALSKALNRKHIDTDELIEVRVGTSIEEIFSLYGESHFRKLESQIIDELYKKENLIISTGGGLILDNNNVVKLKEKGILILLDSSIENIVNNIRNSNTVRPLLNIKDCISERVKAMYNCRKDLYLNSSDLIVLVDDKSIDEIVDEILVNVFKLTLEVNNRD